MKLEDKVKALLTKLQSMTKMKHTLLSSVADPDPKNPHHFAGSGSILFFMDPDPDPDPDLNLAHHHSPPPAHLIFHI